MLKSIFKNKKKLIFIILLLIGVMFVKTMFTKRMSGAVGMYDTVNPVRQDLVFDYSFNAKVLSKKEVLVYSNLIAEVEKVNYRVGDVVKSGDILVELSQNSLFDIKASIERAKINLNQKVEDLKVLQEIYKLGGVSKKELDLANDAVKLAELDLETIYATKKDSSNLIKSTVSGTITELNVDDNFKIDPTKYLFKIVDTENLKIEAEVANSKVKYLSVGDPVTITSESLKDDKEIEAKIDEIAKISHKSVQFNDAVTNIIIDLEKESGLKPGDLVEINVKYDELKNILTLPFIYINQGENGIPYVFVIENDVVVKKEVTLGKTNNILYEIKSGLTENDIVLNNISKMYKEGDKIK